MNNANRKGTLFALAVPILLEQLLRSLMGTVNTFMLSRVSDNASAAVGVANQILNVMIIASSMMASGAAILENQKIGARAERETAQVLMNSLAAAAGIGFIVSFVCMTFATPLVRAMGLNEELVQDSSTYLRIVGATCLFQFVSSMTATHFRCHGKAWVSMAVIVGNNVMNVGGCLLVVNGLAPISGVAGIASVRFVAEAIGLMIILILFAREKWGQQWSDLIHINGKLMKEILRLGFMSGMEGLSYTFGQLVTTSFITGLPTAVLSAKVYTQTLASYPYMAGMAIGSAGQIISGQLIGAGDEEGALKLIRRCWVGVLVLNLCGSIASFSFCENLIGLFTNSAEIAAIARPLFAIDILTCAGRSMNHSFNFGLRSAKFVFWPMVIATTSIWILNVGLGWLLTVWANIGVIGLWISACTDEWVRGLLAAFQWNKKLWMKKK